MKDIRLFIYANSFVTRTVLYHVDYLFNFHVSEILLLKENHTDVEVFHRNRNLKLLFCEKIEDAIIKADMTIALLDDNIPKNKLERIVDFSSQTGKECLVIKNPWATSTVKNGIENLSHGHIAEYSEKPVILLVSTGRFAELYYTELLLNEIMFRENVSIVQEYSESTKLLISQLSAFGIVNESILRSINNSFSHANIIIKSILLTELYSETDEYRIRPDCTIMTCLPDCECFSQLFDLFTYKYNRPLDLVTYLPYVVFEKYEKNDLPIYCNQPPTGLRNLAVDIYNEHIEQILRETVLSKLAMPRGVRII